MILFIFAQALRKSVTRFPQVCRKIIRPFFHQSVYMSDVKITLLFFHKVFTSLSQVYHKSITSLSQVCHKSVVKYVDHSFTRFSQGFHNSITSIVIICHKIISTILTQGLMQGLMQGLVNCLS